MIPAAAIQYNARRVAEMPIRRKKQLGLTGLASTPQAAAAATPQFPIAALDAWAVRANRRANPRLVVAIRSGDGLVGYGETACGPEPNAAVQEFLRHAEVLIGRDALASEAARSALAGVPPEVRGAIDIALLDLRGKVTDAPVHDLLTGRTRDKARAMAALTGSGETDLMKQLAVAKTQGFRAFSIPLDLSPDSPTRGRAFFAQTEAMLGRLREAGADDLVLDCRGASTAAEGAALAARLERFHLMWIDEPTGEISDAALRKISHESVTPVGWGRHLTAGSRFQDLLRMQVVDVVRPDIGLHGITGTRKVAALAEAYYTAIAPFHRGGPIGTAATLQVAASVPNFVVQEVDFTVGEDELRMSKAIAGNSLPRVVEGFFEVPAGPGLGVSVDEDALRSYAV